MVVVAVVLVFKLANASQYVQETGEEIFVFVRRVCCCSTSYAVLFSPTICLEPSKKRGRHFRFNFGTLFSILPGHFCFPAFFAFFSERYLIFLPFYSGFPIPGKFFFSSSGFRSSRKPLRLASRLISRRSGFILRSSWRRRGFLLFSLLRARCILASTNK